MLERRKLALGHLIRQACGLTPSPQGEGCNVAHSFQQCNRRTYDKLQPPHASPWGEAPAKRVMRGGRDKQLIPLKLSASATLRATNGRPYIGRTIRERSPSLSALYSLTQGNAAILPSVPAKGISVSSYASPMGTSCGGGRMKPPFCCQLLASQAVSSA